MQKKRSDRVKAAPFVQVVHPQSPVTPTASAGRFGSDLGEQKAKIGSELSDEG